MDKYKILVSEFFIKQVQNASDDELILMYYKNTNKYAKAEMQTRGLKVR